jgi:hypothetical protein
VVNARLDYPPGVLVGLGTLREGEMEDALLRLLADGDAWRRQSEAGLAHARSVPFDRLADVLLDGLDALISGRMDAA